MNQLAYDERGTGPPIAFLHGMTFNRFTWDPIVDRLANRFRCIAIDLPPASISEHALGVHELLTKLDIEQPIVIGHSAAAVVAFLYASSFHAAGVIDVDASVDVRPFASLVRQFADALRGPRFDQAFEPIRKSIGVELLPEPERSRVAATQTIDQASVLTCFAQIFESTPGDLQKFIDEKLAVVDVPVLAIFGHALSGDERSAFTMRFPNAQLEEWGEKGHMVHLTEPDRFAERIALFASTLERENV